MNSEELLEIISTQESIEYLDMLCEKLLSEWVYFHVIDDGNFIEVEKGSVSNIEEIVDVGKDRPITIPHIPGNHAVIYLTRGLAIKSVEIKSRIGRMKGINALAMFHGMKHINGVYIQGNESYVLVEAERLEKLASAHA